MAFIGTITGLKNDWGGKLKEKPDGAFRKCFQTDIEQIFIDTRVASETTRNYSTVAVWSRIM